MGISPWVSGATLPTWTVTFLTDSNAALPLTGATLVMQIQNKRTKQIASGQGTFSITNGANGIATYTPVPSDSAVVGKYRVRGQATFPGNAPQYSDWEDWEVTE